MLGQGPSRSVGAEPSRRAGGVSPTDQAREQEGSCGDPEQGAPTSYSSYTSHQYRCTTSFPLKMGEVWVYWDTSYCLENSVTKFAKHISLSLLAKRMDGDTRGREQKASVQKAVF